MKARRTLRRLLVAGAIGIGAVFAVSPAANAGL